MSSIFSSEHMRFQGFSETGSEQYLNYFREPLLKQTKKLFKILISPSSHFFPVNQHLMRKQYPQNQRQSKGGQSTMSRISKTQKGKFNFFPKHGEKTKTKWESWNNRQLALRCRGMKDL